MAAPPPCACRRLLPRTALRIHRPAPPSVCPRAADMQQLARSMVVEGEPLLRQRVVGTAAVYWRKLYLRRDFRAADPRLVAPACLFLAAKTGARWAGGRRQGLWRLGR